MSGTAILPCDCKHEFQDSRYRPGNRVHNINAKGDSALCTVCSRPKSFAGKEAKK